MKRPKIGDVFDGYVIGVAPFGLFVELTEHVVEGLVHISTMADDYYRYDERVHVLRGAHTQKTYRLGDRVEVQVIRVDLERRQIGLGLVDILGRVRLNERPHGFGRSRHRPTRPTGRRTMRRGRS